MTTAAPPPPASTSSKASTDLAIDISHAAKVYKGKVHALRGVSMQVRRGEVFGLLGPNGAGKSTLIKILMTVIFPTRCEGTLLGRPVGDKSSLLRVGYLPEHHRFPDYLTGSQVLDFYGAMSKVSRAERRTRAGELLDLVGMSDWGNKRVRGYSKGMRQRLGIAQALINDPDLVLLDEPTDGVDPVGRKEIRAILTKLKDDGKTVFLNSHLLSELEMVCDRVAILVQGQVFSQGTIDELTTDQRRYEIRVLPGQEAIAATVVGGGNSSPATEVAGGLITLKTEDPAPVQRVIDTLRSGGATITEVRLIRPSLEDLFMQAVHDPNTGRAKVIGASAPPPSSPPSTPRPTKGGAA